MDDVPHIAWPVQVMGRTFAIVQQDTSDEVAANVAVLCSFRRGSRIEAPDFGITDPTFQIAPVDTTEIERQIAVYEPRAELAITVTDDRAGAQHVTIAVRVASAEEA
jgi:phage baseplate assembly protein W